MIRPDLRRILSSHVKIREPTEAGGQTKEVGRSRNRRHTREQESVEAQVDGLGRAKAAEGGSKRELKRGIASNRRHSSGASSRSADLIT